MEGTRRVACTWHACSLFTHDHTCTTCVYTHMHTYIHTAQTHARTSTHLLVELKVHPWQRHFDSKALPARRNHKPGSMGASTCQAAQVQARWRGCTHLAFPSHAKLPCCPPFFVDLVQSPLQPPDQIW